MRDIKQLVLANGTLVNPALHDGSLIGLIACRNRRVLILAKDLAENIHCLILLRVERCRGDDFREGNIILDITAETGDKVTREDVAYAFGVEEEDPFLVTVMDKIVADNLVLVRVNPSYGCSFVAVCGGIDKVDDWVSVLTAAG